MSETYTRQESPSEGRRMNHESAVKEYAVERYLLEEMAPAERDAFEEHYFECVECAYEVRAASVFFENLKVVGAENPELARAPRRDWFGWLRWQVLQPALGALCLVILGYQSLVVIPSLKRAAAPRAVTAHLLRSETRGEPAIVATEENTPFILTFAPDQGSRLSSYQAEVRRDSGEQVLSFPISAPPENEPFQVLIPGNLDPGVYTLSIHGQGQEVGRYLFALKFK